MPHLHDENHSQLSTSIHQPTLYPRPILFLWQEGEGHRRQDAHKCGEMVPPDFFAEIQNGEGAKDGERDDLLDDFELGGGINRVAPAIGRHLEQVFEERDAPAHQNNEQQRLALELQVAVPRDGHKNVRAGQQHNRQPAGFGKIQGQKMNSPMGGVKWECGGFSDDSFRQAPSGATSL